MPKSQIISASITDGTIANTDIADSTLTTAKLATPNLGRRNLVINGAMQVAQRGTSQASIGNSTGSGYFTVDRYNTVFKTSGLFTMSQSTVTDLAGFANALKLDCTTADTSIASDEYFLLQYKLEGQNLQQFKKGTSSAEKMTVSFYVKGNANATYVCELYDQDNAREIAQTFSVTSSWQRIVLTYDGDTTGAFDDDNVLSMYISFWLHSGSNHNSGTLSTTWTSITNANRAVGISSFFDSTDRTLEITGLQLEVGSQATPFEHRLFGEELALCQRYLYSIDEAVASTPVHLIGYNQAGGACRYGLHNQMRAAPTVTTSNIQIFHGTGSTVNITSIDSQRSQGGLTGFRANPASAITAGDAVAFYTNGTNAYIRFDSEL